MTKKAIGYIASHPFWGNAYIPQRIQNNLVRLYSKNNNLSLVWSIPEVSINYKKTPALKNFLKNASENIDSVIFISYQMNHPSIIVESIIEILNKSIEVHFVMENSNIKNLNSLEKLKSEIRLSYLLSSNTKSPLLK